jgi:cysteine synthase B
VYNQQIILEFAGIRKCPKEYLPKIFNHIKASRFIEISDVKAKKMTQRLAKDECFFAGFSSGGVAKAAVRLCEELEEGVVVSIICVHGNRYL